MPGRNFLFIPGPTNVPRRIQNAMYVEQEDMRAMDLPEFTKPLYEDLKKIFKTKDGINEIKFAFPHLSPSPLIVPCTCRTPAKTAVKEFATAFSVSLCA